MAYTGNTTSTMAGLFKEIYGDSVIDAYAFAAPLLAEYIKFNEQEAGIGNKFHMPVDLQLEHGFTYAAPDSRPTGTGYLGPTSGQMQDAQAQGFQLHGRHQVDYESIYRASQAGKKAFEEATKRVVKRASMSGLKRLEIAMLHGGQGLGQMSVLAAETGAGPFTSVLTISDTTWAAGIWAGMKGVTLDFYDPTGATQRNVNGGATVVCTVTKVDTVNKQLTISYATARASWTSALASTDLVFFQSEAGNGASTPTDVSGLDTWAQLNAASGTFFNIAAGTFELWQANQYSASTGVISFGKLLEANSLVASYGLLTGDMLYALGPRAWEVLNTDQAALRRYDVSFRASSAENGQERLSFHGQTGRIELLPHPFQKDGLCIGFCPNEVKRIGATDFTFIRRFGNTEKLILEVGDTPASEMRTYVNQQLFVEQPRHLVRMGGITY